MTTSLDTAFDEPQIGDFFDDENRWDRPERTEDRVPRDKNDHPRILPPGEVMPVSESARMKVLRSYDRPSGWGKVIEDRFRLNLWYSRMTVDGMMAERRFRAEWAAAGPELLPDGTKDRAAIEKRNAIMKEAQKRAKAKDKAAEGTAVHAFTERRDLGLPIQSIPEEYEGNLLDWARLTQHLEILDVECFVTEDNYKLAGTFDRLVRYHVPCPNCGRYNRIADLKTGRIDYGAVVMACQLGVYAHGMYYNPATGERTPLPDVCQCRGIVIDIPVGEPEGSGRLKWLNIAQGWNDVVRLSEEVRKIRRKSNWWLDFNPVPDIMPLIAVANSRDELNALYASHRAIWRPVHTEAGNRRVMEAGL